MKKNTIVILLLFFWAINANAEDTKEATSANNALFSSTAPITIKADKLKVIDRGTKAIYSGNVLMTQQKIKINADEVTLEKEGEKIKKVMAVGLPVTIINEDSINPFKAKSTNLNYDLGSGWLILTGGNPVITRGKDRIDGRIIKYNLETEDIEAQGYKDKPALLIIDPETNKKNKR